jgi:hypothetical protein
VLGVEPEAGAYRVWCPAGRQNGLVEAWPGDDTGDVIRLQVE